MESLYQIVQLQHSIYEELYMSKAKVGVSMLYCLGEPFNRMVKRLGTMNTKYIEILDDGTYDLNKIRITEIGRAHV